ncbi:polysaccharide biosynthesis/export family protein [Olivibacter sp. CPCC 100613]|uniref:polysaccharide biosynthesis/export family protein n=1 Tax=Olivibacter sp. CPCC 100613 TaxID=3079931 RepID=UPI002FF7FA85
MNNFKKMVMLSLLSLLLMTSCMTSKKIVYVNDMVPDSALKIQEMSLLRIQKNDRLSITVGSKNPELVAPFLTGTGTYSIRDNGEIKTENRANAGGQNYLVDQQGEITFPLLGNLQVVGMSLDEVRNLIQERLIEEKIVNDPIVKIEILNVKVSVMGAVRNELVISVPDGRMTLLEAISKAGGLEPNAAPDRVTVIREGNGERVRILNDIESKKIFDSPAYYLQQNDIVYVEPKSAAYTPKEERNFRVFSSLLGALTLIISVISIAK